MSKLTMSNSMNDDKNCPISQSTRGIKYVAVNEAGKDALKSLKEWYTILTGKPQSYNSTILYLNSIKDELSGKK